MNAGHHRGRATRGEEYGDCGGVKGEGGQWERGFHSAYSCLDLGRLGYKDMPGEKPPHESRFE